MNRESKSKTLLQSLLQVREDLDKLFYYSEGEVLQKRLPKPGSWSVLEVFHHINLLNAHYLKQLEQKAAKQSQTGDGFLERSISGRLLIWSMSHKENGALRLKMKSPAKIDPLKQKAQGIAIVEQVVFRQLINDLDALQDWCEKLANQPLDRVKVPAVIELFSINGAEAIELMVLHTARHLAQAKRIVEA